MPKPWNGIDRLLLAIVTAVLLVTSHVTSQEDNAVGFDPFATDQMEPITLPERRVDQGPTIPEIEFNNNEISMVFQIVSDATGWSIFPTTEVTKAKISLWAKDISTQQLLDTAVTLAGFTYHREHDTITVMTYDEYAQFHGLAKEVIALQYASADSVAVVLKPFLSKMGKSVVHQETNAIVLFDSDANLETIVGMIEQLDVPDDAQAVLEVVDLRYMDAQQLADTLQKVFTEEQVTSSQQPNVVGRPTTGKPNDKTGEAPPAPPQSVSSPRSRVGVYPLDRTNQLILKAFQGDIERLKSLVDKLDTYVEPTSTTYHFVYVDASEIFTGLERILDLPTRAGTYGRSQGQRRQEGGKPCGITLVEKTNSILLTAPPSVHRVMATIVKSVDAPSTYESGIIRLYRVENADVEEVAQAIRELLQPREEREGKPGEPKFKPDATTEEPPSESPDQMELSETEKYIPRVEARVAVSKATNSVIVQATARQHRELERLMEVLDKRRRQVLIESRIVEVITAEGLDLGVELSQAGRDGYWFTAFGLSTNLDPRTGARDIIVSPGGSAAVVDPDTVQGILKAMQSEQNARVVSAPRILVNDNAVGFINSIEEEPITQINQGEVTDTVSFAGFVEAGTQFAITPHISESDYLRVEYEITLNSFGEESTDPSVPPSRNTTSIRSEATVPNGHTIIVGGLRASQETKFVNKVPLLGDIPILQMAFRSTSVKKAYKTTYLFITPVIMDQRDFSDLKDVSEQTAEKIDLDDHAEDQFEARDDNAKPPSK